MFLYCSYEIILVKYWLEVQIICTYISGQTIENWMVCQDIFSHIWTVGKRPEFAEGKQNKINTMKNIILKIF